MFLSELTNKEIFVGKNPRGIVKGVAISLKTHEVKYLLCANAKTSRAIFAVPIRAVVSVDERIYLSRLRPVLPKHCACVFLQLPVYSFEGEHLGALQELSLQSFVATTLFTDKNISFPVSAILACSDAVLLKKEQPYPLGQRIPAPFLPLLTEKEDGVVTKPILRVAAQKNSLVKLTLALPPFSIGKL
ncbi:MAG: hypothetical protein J6K86_05315 [Clostridia bacterium]|nr:hypothetical protein [Clostridia bacterium]MBP3423165.1 hypothetical protein [Clostridia bacterium]